MDPSRHSYAAYSSASIRGLRSDVVGHTAAAPQRTFAKCAGEHAGVEIAGDAPDAGRERASRQNCGVAEELLPDDASVQSPLLQVPITCAPVPPPPARVLVGAGHGLWDVQGVGRRGPRMQGSGRMSSGVRAACTVGRGPRVRCGADRVCTVHWGAAYSSSWRSLRGGVVYTAATRFRDPVLKGSRPRIFLSDPFYGISDSTQDLWRLKSVKKS
jgi:hypothetical protein